MRISGVLFLILALFLLSCNNPGKDNVKVRKPGKEELADLNTYMVQKDRERIENYIERRDLKMTESPTGLWYQIKSEGTGNYFTDNERVVMEYNCSLLDGTTCYSSDETGPEEVVVGRSGMTAGMNQGLRMLKPGGEAVFIIPPFLAYGLKGDGNKIPARSVIVYEVKILNNRIIN